MFHQQYLNVLAAIILLTVALFSWQDKHNPRRLTTSLFWGLYGFIFLVGDWAYDLMSRITGHENATSAVYIMTGILVTLMALIAGFGGVKSGKHGTLSEVHQQASADVLGNRLFLPALSIPVITVVGILLFNNFPSLQEAVFGPGNHATLITLFSMTCGCITGWLIALGMTKDTPAQSIQETRRLLDSIGWAFILPQVLATLGLLFAQAGVGSAVTWLAKSWLALDNRFIAVVAYVLGMALLTMIMGNAFAAFPVIASGIGIPVLLMEHGGNPAVMAAIGMFSGYCGTLMTPMAANYNIVPVALLELPDKNAVIKAQAPTGTILLFINIFLLYFLMKV